MTRSRREERRPLYIHEIFPSFQGEGVLAGAPQVFLRLSGCNLACRYCDTPQARERRDTCRVAAWRGTEEEIPNPVGAEEAKKRVLSLWSPGMHTVSVTGGEPLLQAEELAALLPKLRREGVPVYLETNGTLHAGLERVLDLVDWVAMDIKLPSALGGLDLLGEQRLFLRLARSRRVFLKCVIEPETGDDELEDACRALSREAADAPLVLQPATPRPGKERIAPSRAFELCGLAAAYFREVRVLPQLHRLWGIE